MDTAIKLMDAIGKLFGSIAWPVTVAVIAVMILRRHRSALDKLFERTESAKLPGGVELGFSAVEAQTERVIEAVNKVAEAAPEQKDSAFEELAREGERLSAVRHLSKTMDDHTVPIHVRQKALDEMRANGWFEGHIGSKEITTVEELDRSRWLAANWMPSSTTTPGSQPADGVRKLASLDLS